MKARFLGVATSLVFAPTAHAIRCKARIGLEEEQHERTLRTSFR